jgi:lipoprotein-releasing system permease protein
VWLKGVSVDYAKYSGVASHLIRGGFEIGTRQQPGIVMGAGGENALQVMAGREVFPITVYLPNRLSQSAADPLEAIHSANATPTGSFVIQQDFDNQYAFTNKEFLSYMLDLPASQASSIEIFTDSAANTNAMKKQLEKMLGNNFVVKTRYEQNQSLYAAMQAEKLIIYAVAFLILVIAAFNIISSLTMTVLEKQEDIAVLQAMGTSSGRVSAIFLKLGAILAGLGGLAGCLLGLIICLGQREYHWVKLGGQSFVIDYYPVTMRLSDFMAVTAIVFIIAFFSGWLPSRKASKTEYSLKS